MLVGGWHSRRLSLLFSPRIHSVTPDFSSFKSCGIYELNMTEDYFWGTTLSSTNKEIKWEPDALRENGGIGEISLSAKGEHTLIIKQALLSAEVPDNQVNVVEVETTGYKKNIKLPIINLVGGKNSHVLLDLNFPDPPVTLRLIQGNGPVHISGNHVINAEQYNDDDEDEDEDEDIDEFDEQVIEEEDEEEEVEAEEKKREDKGGKKRTNSNSAQSQPKKKKKGSKDD